MTDRKEWSGLVECNGGNENVRQPPSHYVAMDTTGIGDSGIPRMNNSGTELETFVDSDGQTHLADRQPLCNRTPSLEENVKSSKKGETAKMIDKCNNVNNMNGGVGVVCRGTSYTRRAWCYRRLTLREKYLSIVCLMLFFSCVAFIMVAFVRDRHTNCPCHGKNFEIFFIRWKFNFMSFKGREMHEFKI